MKLTAEKVAEARRRVRASATISSIALEWGLPHSTLAGAVMGRRWKGVAEEPPSWPEEEAPLEDPISPKRALTREDVLEGRRAYRAGESLMGIVSRLGVSYSALYQAVKGNSWKHVTEEPPVTGRRPRKGETQVRRSRSNRRIMPSEVEALRQAVLEGMTVAEAWRSTGLKDKGSPYATALDAVRGDRHSHLAISPPVKGPLKRGRPRGAPPSGRTRPPLFQEEDVREARRLAHAGDWTGLDALQERLEVNHANLRMALKGITWAHLQDPPPWKGTRPSPRILLTKAQVVGLRKLLRVGHTLRCSVALLDLPRRDRSLEVFRRAALGVGVWADLTDPPPFLRSGFKGLEGCCRRRGKGSPVFEG
jgi:hypothetical protein